MRHQLFIYSCDVGGIHRTSIYLINWWGLLVAGGDYARVLIGVWLIHVYLAPAATQGDVTHDASHVPTTGQEKRRQAEERQARQMMKKGGGKGRARARWEEAPPGLRGRIRHACSGWAGRTKSGYVSSEVQKPLGRFDLASTV